MGIQWLTTMKPSFQTAWLALSLKEKLTLLSQDPSPDGKVKKQLKYLDGKLHRLRCGDYRIFYTFQKPYISLLALVRRCEDTYDEEQDAEFPGGLDPFVPGSPKTPHPDWERLLSPHLAEKRTLPEPITAQLLMLLHVPEQYHARQWSDTVTGPTQVKGAPGTGKSTVALYRIRSLIENVCRQKQPLQGGFRLCLHLISI